MSIKKAYYCKKYLDENGVPQDKRPVWYDEDTGHDGIVTRVFVSASWFREWDAWHQQAEKALNATKIKHDSFKGAFEMYGDGYPIVGDPQYLFERSDVWVGGYTIWINALCPNESEFKRAVAEAESRIENKGKPIEGQRVASINAPLPMLPISSREFQDAPGTVGALWK